jgi:hypothetical protein
MNRVRISTTVDSGKLEAARRLFGGADSGMMDRALGALIAELERDAEIKALERYPYVSDSDLSWAHAGSDGPALPYDGEIPAKVLAKARARRRKR